MDDLYQVIIEFFNQTKPAERALYRSLSRRPSTAPAQTETLRPQSPTSTIRSTSTIRTVPRTMSVSASPDSIPIIPIGLFDSLRPPAVSYGKQLVQTRLFLPNSKCCATAISASGSFVGWFEADRFKIFDTTSYIATLVCSGRFKKQRYYYSQDGTLTQTSSDRRSHKFCCAALSDCYAVVGTSEGMLLVFAVQGVRQGARPGQWLCCADLSVNVIEQVLFTPSGDDLLVLMSPRNQRNPSKILGVCSTTEFAKTNGVTDEEIKSVEIPKAIVWADSALPIAAAALSSDGRKLVLCSSRNHQNDSIIQILRKSLTDQKWRRIFSNKLKVVEMNESHSPGVTGICLYHPQYLQSN